MIYIYYKLKKHNHAYYYKLAKLTIYSTIQLLLKKKPRIFLKTLRYREKSIYRNTWYI